MNIFYTKVLLTGAAAVACSGFGAPDRTNRFPKDLFAANLKATPGVSQKNRNFPSPIAQSAGNPSTTLTKDTGRAVAFPPVGELPGAGRAGSSPVLWLGRSLMGQS